jgi:hypothetical protein
MPRMTAPAVPFAGRLLARLAALAGALLLAAGVQAQTNPTRELPKDARTGYLSHVVENAFTLDGQRIVLSPGGVIRGTNNHILMPSVLPKESLVLYTKDPNGNLFRAWVLTRDEAAKVGVASAVPWQTSPEVGTPIGQVLNSNSGTQPQLGQRGQAPGFMQTGPRTGDTNLSGQNPTGSPVSGSAP